MTMPPIDEARLLRGRADALPRDPGWDARALVCTLDPATGRTAVLAPGEGPNGGAEVIAVLANPARLDARGQPTVLDPGPRVIAPEGARELSAMAAHLLPAPYGVRMAGLAWWLHRFEALRRAAR